ncbi:MAG: hypothetical protein ABSF50_04695 [Burkholderiaceae bacterium]|jgi:hypothetical protein
MNEQQVTDLILQSLEHEKGGVLVYETALKCVQNKDLAGEWKKYLDQTRGHVEILETVCASLSLDPDQEIPSRKIVRALGQALVTAMEEASKGGNPDAAELVACECIVLAETKDHLDWELISRCAEHSKGTMKKVLKQAAEEVEDQEDEHLYHTKGWCRELWIQALGMQAVLPPLEEEKEVKTAIGAARAEQAADKERQ